jgi:hypothetical protein
VKPLCDDLHAIAKGVKIKANLEVNLPTNLGVNLEDKLPANPEDNRIPTHAFLLYPPAKRLRAPHPAKITALM